jgi:KaiC/GvpD/RAD55 family RecA-like ATPase
MNTSKGHNFFDPETHKMDKLNTRPSGFPFIDTCLNGGLFNRSLIVLMGGPKTGKSQWLCNLAAQSVKNGYNTLYITLEMSYQKVAKRIGANLFNISVDDYDRCSKDPNFMTQTMKSFY